MATSLSSTCTCRTWDHSRVSQARLVIWLLLVFKPIAALSCCIRASPVPQWLRWQPVPAGWHRHKLPVDACVMRGHRPGSLKYCVALKGYTRVTCNHQHLLTENLSRLLFLAPVANMAAKPYPYLAAGPWHRPVVQIYVTSAEPIYRPDIRPRPTEPSRKVAYWYVSLHISMTSLYTRPVLWRHRTHCSHMWGGVGAWDAARDLDWDWDTGWN